MKWMIKQFIVITSSIRLCIERKIRILSSFSSVITREFPNQDKKNLSNRTVWVNSQNINRTWSMHVTMLSSGGVPPRHDIWWPSDASLSLHVNSSVSLQSRGSRLDRETSSRPKHSVHQPLTFSFAGFHTHTHTHLCANKVGSNMNRSEHLHRMSDLDLWRHSGTVKMWNGLPSGRPIQATTVPAKLVKWQAHVGTRSIISSLNLMPELYVQLLEGWLVQHCRPLIAELTRHHR